MNHDVFVSAAKGLEYLLEAELTQLGLTVTKVCPQGVYGTATLTVLYNLCLWSRLANRVQVILFAAEADNEQSIHAVCQSFHWQTVFMADKTFAIAFHGDSAHIRNTMFGAQLVKDGIVDHFRALNMPRPSVDKENPQVLLHARLKDGLLTLSLDLTGYSLHQRGYRTEAGAAPLKETLAAAMLIRAQWPRLAALGYGLYDPCCGSGTLVIEAAMMAAHIAPGLLRTDQALQHWVLHEPSLWEKQRANALHQVKPLHAPLCGSDHTQIAIAQAQANAQRAGVTPLVSFKQQAMADCRAPVPTGLLICNPPYGERLSDEARLKGFYKTLGQTVHSHFQGWEMAVITTSPVLAKATGLRSHKQYTLYNGSLECKLYCFSLHAENQLNEKGETRWSSGAQMFANRLKKNQQHLQKWAKREAITCYRLYDADLPEYAFAIDCYNDYVVLQEYTAPRSIDPIRAAARAAEVPLVVEAVLNIPSHHLVMKKREAQKGSNQYQKMGQTHQEMVVCEGKVQLKVNLYDYLDTGLFLDHRLLRRRLGQMKPNQRFLNCFCYTASASVHAAMAGARTTNVDLSNTYLRWAEDNFRLNTLDLARHQFVAFDCLQWLALSKDKFDVILLDPPSFSNSKRMQTTLDVQRDHITLIDAAMRLLASEGILYFSTHFRKFKLAPEILERYRVTDMNASTLDEDFKRNPRIHYCVSIQRKLDVSSL